MKSSAFISDFYVCIVYVTDASLIDQAIFIQFFIVTKMVNEYRIFFNISIKHNKYVEHPVYIRSHMVKGVYCVIDLQS